MISVILMETENPGNVGAVARSMANFGFDNLILIRPLCDHLSRDAIRRAKYAGSILKKAKKRTKRVLSGFDYLVGTTARMGRDYNIPRSPVSPKEFAAIASKLREKDARIGLLFGREGIGLTNEEIKRCDFVVTIPSSKDYGSLNLSHAVSIMLYELFSCSGTESISSHIMMAGSAEKEQIMKMLKAVLDSLHFSTPGKKQTQLIVWKKIFGKSFLTKREAYAVMGFFKKLINKCSAKKK